MTEAEWLSATDPTPMLSMLKRRLSHRQIRLLACGLCETYRSYLTDERSLQAIETAYRVADGTDHDGERQRSFVAAHSAANWTYESDMAAEVAAFTCGEREQVSEAIWRAIRACAFDIYQHPQTASCLLLRDIFGNPFRPVAVDPTWLTSDVAALATGIYADRAFDQMPILADALQDAGCDNDDVLNHCRDPKQVHVRGCWVVDLVLGRN